MILLIRRQARATRTGQAAVGTTGSRWRPRFRPPATHHTDVHDRRLSANPAPVARGLPRGHSGIQQDRPVPDQQLRLHGARPKAFQRGRQGPPALLQAQPADERGDGAGQSVHNPLALAAAARVAGARHLPVEHARRPISRRPCGRCARPQSSDLKLRPSGTLTAGEIRQAFLKRNRGMTAERPKRAGQGRPPDRGLGLHGPEVQAGRLPGSNGASDDAVVAMTPMAPTKSSKPALGGPVPGMRNTPAARHRRQATVTGLARASKASVQIREDPGKRPPKGGPGAAGQAGLARTPSHLGVSFVRGGTASCGPQGSTKPRPTQSSQMLAPKVGLRKPSVRSEPVCGRQPSQAPPNAYGQASAVERKRKTGGSFRSHPLLKLTSKTVSPSGVDGFLRSRLPSWTGLRQFPGRRPSSTAWSCRDRRSPGA